MQNRTEQNTDLHQKTSPLVDLSPKSRAETSQDPFVIGSFWRSRYTGTRVCIVWRYIARHGMPMIRYQKIGGARSQSTCWTGYFAEHYVPVAAVGVGA